jgi:hypothetical protein
MEKGNQIFVNGTVSFVDPSRCTSGLKRGVAPYNAPPMMWQTRFLNDAFLFYCSHRWWINHLKLLWWK